MKTDDEQHETPPGHTEPHVLQPFLPRDFRSLNLQGLGIVRWMKLEKPAADRR